MFLLFFTFTRNPKNGAAEPRLRNPGLYVAIFFLKLWSTRVTPLPYRNRPSMIVIKYFLSTRSAIIETQSPKIDTENCLKDIY